ncbi:plastocyanin/azurin family copper-binding protein [Haloferax sp. Atlit-48N]|uniref:Plastocyanin/azurin family copper-binding protein n=1 Tax=Haloferax sp. Atlit-48N TaxID=2077198 RepID=A0ACD5HWY0_9EURY|nr:halocyanin [Haloferax sp. Atlit-48N]
MNRRTFMKNIAGGVAVLGTSTGVTGASNENSTAESGGGTDAGGGSGGGGSTTHTIQMVTEGGEYYFDPVGLHVDPGDTVEWVLESGDHSATAYAESNQAEQRIPADASGFDSGLLGETGASFSYTFEVEGTYDYFCSPHKQLGMVGRVVCGDPGGPAEEGAIPNEPGSGLMPGSGDIVEAGSLSYPYVPSGGSSGSLPWQFWAAAGGLGTAVVAMVSKYDRASGRYSE